MNGCEMSHVVGQRFTPVSFDIKQAENRKNHCKKSRLIEPLVLTGPLKAGRTPVTTFPARIPAPF